MSVSISAFRRCVLAAVCSAAFIAAAVGFAAAKETDKWGTARELYQKGNFFLEMKEYREAQRQYQKALRLLYGPDFKIANPETGFMLVEEPSDPQRIAPTNAVAPDEPAATPRPVSGIAEGGEYYIGTDDVLFISVWQNPDLTQETVVRPDGRISYPLVGDVQASGRTITQLDRDLTERLKEFIRAPEVSVAIRKVGGQKVIVLGEVRSSGVVSVTGARTIIEAIGLCGGFTRDAVPSSTILIRGGFNSPTAQRINLSKALKGMPQQNIALQSEDIIFVPKKFIADVNYFLGQVLEPISRGLYTARELQGY